MRSVREHAMRVLLFVLPFVAGPSAAQHPEGHSGFPRGSEMMREASGTSWQPDSTPHAAIHRAIGSWSVMSHGMFAGVFARQAGDRGSRRLFGTGMAMAQGSRQAGPGELRLRAMLSPEPAMGRRGYPLLLQTGETADGTTPLIDRQHPHDLFMELSAAYRVPAGDGVLSIYAGWPGEPALGPPVFMHRFSGLEFPEAPLGHHWMDSTHISFGVLTAGYERAAWRIEGSAFNGREPDEKRWDLESGRLDSRSVRLSVNPAPFWSFQAGYGRLEDPEQLEPGERVERLTASVSRNFMAGSGRGQATAVWGRNSGSGKATDALLLESTLEGRRATFLVRAERVEKDELFPAPDPRAGEAFLVHKFTVGALRGLAQGAGWSLGVGLAVSWNAVPDEIESDYGRDPSSASAWVRLRWG